MTTGTQIIERSARMIGVKAQGQSLSADKTAAFLEALNAMLIRWEANGLSMGFSALSAATATIAIPVENEEGVCANLAVVMAPEYGKEASPRVQMMAMEGLAALERDVVKPIAASFDLPCSDAVVASHDIQNDN